MQGLSIQVGTAFARDHLVVKLEDRSWLEVVLWVGPEETASDELLVVEQGGAATDRRTGILKAAAMSTISEVVCPAAHAATATFSSAVFGASAPA